MKLEGKKKDIIQSIFFYFFLLNEKHLPCQLIWISIKAKSLTTSNRQRMWWKSPCPLLPGGDNMIMFTLTYE